MNRDLFGQEIDEQDDEQIAFLKYKDEISLLGRTKRFKHLHKINPEGSLIMGGAEFALSVMEMQWCYIEGFYLSVIVLGQTIAEKLLSNFVLESGASKKVAGGLSSILFFLKEKKLMDDYLINRLDFIRKIRNPIIHYKTDNYEYNLDVRTYSTGLPQERQLESDAKSVMEIVSYIGLYWLK